MDDLVLGVDVLHWPVVLPDLMVHLPLHYLQTPSSSSYAGGGGGSGRLPPGGLGVDLAAVVREGSVSEARLSPAPVDLAACCSSPAEKPLIALTCRVQLTTKSEARTRAPGNDQCPVSSRPRASQAPHPRHQVSPSRASTCLHVEQTGGGIPLPHETDEPQSHAVIEKHFSLDF